MSPFEIYIIATSSFVGGMTLMGLLNAAIAKAKVDAVTQVAQDLPLHYTQLSTTRQSEMNVHQRISEIEKRIENIKKDNG